MSETTPTPSQPVEPGIETPSATGETPEQEAGGTGTEAAAADPIDVAAARARLTLPDLRPAPPAEPVPLPPAPPTYREMEHLLRDLA
ncbi:MAG: hypothetical protein BGO51_05640 [Rhodospirillales bacterium 69-11]|nr:hypothetical protein [Rhodospirillales bacterium]OJW27206.1 MAG: hypothetical protein BGO51_05640 [Rhodospirillales bacterium 69-11]